MPRLSPSFSSFRARGPIGWPAKFYFAACRFESCRARQAPPLVDLQRGSTAPDRRAGRKTVAIHPLAARTARQCPVSSLRVHDKATRWDSRVGSGPSTREACSSLAVSRQPAGARLIAGPGLSLVHLLASVRQDLPHENIEPDHSSPPFASSQSRKEQPRCRSNQPSLEFLAKVQMR